MSAPRVAPFEKRVREPADVRDDGLERDLLGGILLHSELFAAAVNAGCGADDFAHDATRIVWRTLSKVAAAGQPPDMLAVRARLSDDGGLDAVGLPALLALPDGLPVRDAEQVQRVCARLRQLAAARRALYRLDQTRAALADHPAQASPLLQALVDDLRVDDATPERGRLLTVGELVRRGGPAMLVDGILPDRGIAVLAGPAGAGKSLLAVDLACCVATGQPWAGFPVARQGNVVFVGAEGVAGLGARFTAWTTARSWADLVPVYIWSDTLAVRQSDAVQALISEAAPLNPVLLVVDTLNRTLFGDENAARDMGEYVAGLDQLRLGLACSVVVVHHTGWGEQNRERGHSSLRGAADLVALVQRTAHGARVTCEKARDLPPFRPLTFEFQPVPDTASVVARLAPDAPSLVAPDPAEHLDGSLLALLRARPGSSTRQVYAATAANKGRVRTQLAALVAAGHVTTQRGPRGSLLWFPQPGGDQ